MAALAAILRFWALGAASFQIDEAMSLIGAAQWRHGFQDVHPPLYYALLEQWGRFGVSEAWLRSGSVLASLLSLFLYAGLVRRWRPDLVPSCVFMLVFSFADLQQAREVRMYACLQLFSLVYFVALSQRRALWSALALLAACFTHLFGLFLVPLGLLAVESRATNEEPPLANPVPALPSGGVGWRWTVVVVALWLAWGVPHYLSQRDHPLGLRQAPSLSMGIEAVGRLLGGRIAPFGDTPSLALGGLALACLIWRRPACPRLVYGWALLPWLSVWLVSRFTPLQIFEFKYLVWTLPAWIYLLASCLPLRLLLPSWLLLNLFGVLPFLQTPHRWLADWRGAAQALRGGTQVVCVHPSMMAAPLFYYGYQSPRLKLVDEWSQVEPERDMIWVTTPNHPYVAQQQLLVGVGKFWKLERTVDFFSELPSSQIQVTFWSWVQGRDSAGEKQGR